MSDDKIEPLARRTGNGALASPEQALREAIDQAVLDLPLSTDAT